MNKFINVIKLNIFFLRLYIIVLIDDIKRKFK